MFTLPGDWMSDDEEHNEIPNVYGKKRKRGPDIVDIGDGNTSKSPIIRSKYWFFTWNNYPDTVDTEIPEWGCDKWVYQPEVGENGTPHIQGIIVFQNSRTFQQMKQKNDKIHWEKCRSLKACIDYCSKVKSRVGETRVKGLTVKRPLIDPIAEPREWQAKVLAEVKLPPDNRTVNWYVDEAGGKGKTSLCKHLCMNYNALLVGGKANDIKYGIVEWIKTKGDLEIVVINITRSMEQYISYEAIESVKDGIFFSGKYESGMCIFNSPHVYVFANFEPDYTKLTEDRWNIVHL